MHVGLCHVDGANKLAFTLGCQCSSCHTQAVMDANLKSLVEAHAPHLVVTDDGKIKCNLNGHQFPPKLELVQGFVNGAKYKKLVAKAAAEAALPKYDPFLVPSINFPDKLFCALTGMLITKNMDAVKQHMKGRKFNKAKERFQADKQDLLEEPSMQDAMDEDGAEGAGGEDEGPGIWIPEGVESDSEEEGGEQQEGAEDQSGGEEEQAAAGDGDAMQEDGAARDGAKKKRAKRGTTAGQQTGRGRQRAREAAAPTAAPAAAAAGAAAAAAAAGAAAGAAPTSGGKSSKSKQRGKPSKAKKQKT